MPEAEEVLQEVAWHTTVFVRNLLQRRNARAAPSDSLHDRARRLDLLLTAVFGRSFALRPAQAPPPPTLLARIFRGREGPRADAALPATDGDVIWLPEGRASGASSSFDPHLLSALRMAVRACRGSVMAWSQLGAPLPQAYFIVLEAQAADAQLGALLPGVAAGLGQLRRAALARRPPVQAFPAYRRRLEGFARERMAGDASAIALASAVPSVDEVQRLALEQAEIDFRVNGPAAPGRRLLYRDLWTGELRSPSSAMPGAANESPSSPDAPVPRSARLERAPRVRQAPEGEDERQPGAWMVQTSQPQEKAEDPAGLQRPSDRDDSTAADEWADALAELPEARLVHTPGQAKEVLLSDDPPRAGAGSSLPTTASTGCAFRYPEWDFTLAAYREHAVQVLAMPATDGDPEWVDRTLREHAGLLAVVRRRFEMLKATRLRLRKQLDGPDIDVDACVEARADYLAGLPMPQAFYQADRTARRDLAVLILTDASGSTDGWVSAGKRVIDVEREALLLVSEALRGLREPVALQAFSGQGPLGVQVRVLKAFDEPFSPTVGRRIAGLEPERYTRAGAALRHATASLMQQPARHRLLLLLSDGRPNDVDRYEGQYGVEDLRQAVAEAHLQGVHVFCLTVDRQGAAYLPRVFGAGRYAMLPRPELLPGALLDWMRRLVQA